MKRALLWFLPLGLLCACDPFPKDDDAASPPPARAASPKPNATPKPTPAPGAWMTDKTRNNPLDEKAHR